MRRSRWKVCAARVVAVKGRSPCCEDPVKILTNLGASLFCCLVLSLPCRAFAQIWLAIDKPLANEHVGDSLVIALSTMGPIVRIEAVIGSKSAVLSASGGTLSLVGESVGAKTLVVTAYDSSNAPTSTSVQIVYDAPPRLEVLEPVPGQVLRSTSVRVRARCTSSTGGCAIQVADASAPGGTFDKVVQLPPEADGTRYKINVTTRDGADRTTTLPLEVLVEASPKLRDLIVAPGREVLDFDGTRALLRDAEQTHALIVDSSGAVTTVYDGANQVVRGELSTAGAVLILALPSDQGGTKPVAHFWNGTLTALDAFDAHITGHSLAYVRQSIIQTGSCGGPALPYCIQTPLIKLRDLSSGADVWEWSDTTSSSVLEEFAVSANGDVIWRLSSEGGLIKRAFWRRAGEVKQLTGPARGVYNLRIDDGVASVMPFAIPTPGTDLLLGNETVHLCTRVSPTPSATCQPASLAGGWTGYSSFSSTDQPRAFRRSPAGQIEQIGDSFAALTAISPAGESVVETTRRFLAKTPTTPVEVSSTLGRPVYRADWYVLLGGSVLRIDPTGTAVDADAGIIVPAQPSDSSDSGFVAPDGGWGDAGARFDGGIDLVDAGELQGVDGGSTASRPDAAASAPSSKADDDGCSLSSRENDGITLRCALLLFALAYFRRRIRARSSVARSRPS